MPAHVHNVPTDVPHVPVNVLDVPVDVPHVPVDVPPDVLHVRNSMFGVSIGIRIDCHAFLSYVMTSVAI